MRHGEAPEVQIVELGVAIRQGGGIQVGPDRVETDQKILKVGAA
jgi:hypothetical protein